MSTNSTPKKRRPTGSANSTAGGTERHISAGNPANDNFQWLKDRFARQGHRLYRSDPADGCVVCFVERMGFIELDISIDQALDRVRALEAQC